MNGKIEQQILGEYTSQGFSLEECGDHVTVIWYKDAMIAAFSQVAATPELLKDVCRRHLVRIAEPAEVA